MTLTPRTNLRVSFADEVEPLLRNHSDVDDVSQSEEDLKNNASRGHTDALVFNENTFKEDEKVSDGAHCNADDGDHLDDNDVRDLLNDDPDPPNDPDLQNNDGAFCDVEYHPDYKAIDELEDPDDDLDDESNEGSYDFCHEESEGHTEGRYSQGDSNDKADSPDLHSNNRANFSILRADRHFVKPDMVASEDKEGDGDKGSDVIQPDADYLDEDDAEDDMIISADTPPSFSSRPLSTSSVHEPIPEEDEDVQGLESTYIEEITITVTACTPTTELATNQDPPSELYVNQTPHGDVIIKYTPPAECEINQSELSMSETPSGHDDRQPTPSGDHMIQDDVISPCADAPLRHDPPPCVMSQYDSSKDDDDDNDDYDSDEVVLTLVISLILIY